MDRNIAVISKIKGRLYVRISFENSGCVGLKFGKGLSHRPLLRHNCPSYHVRMSVYSQLPFLPYAHQSRQQSATRSFDQFTAFSSSIAINCTLARSQWLPTSSRSAMSMRSPSRFKTTTMPRRPKQLSRARLRGLSHLLARS